MYKHKIILICPKWGDKGLNSVPFFKSIPPQGLIQLASLTPLDWEVKIIDENNAAIDFNESADIVGLTGMTALAPRAYEIAKEFKKRNITVIMGGIHASMLPDEVSKYFDSVIIGEADLIWPKILDDFKKNKLQPIYKADTPKSLDFHTCRYINKTYPFYPIKKIPYGLKLAYVQTQRGCPNNCKFCSVTKFNGTIVRTKPIPQVIEEIKKEKEKGFHLLIFVDDNILANKEYAKNLFKELKHLKIRWLSQTDIKIADDDVLDLACESGLSGVFLGLESISPTNLKDSVCTIKKHWRPKYEDVIKKLRRKGVIIEASFIFGFDGGDNGIIKTTVDWAIKNKIDLAQFSILTPLPGTTLFEELEKQGRIITNDWAKYNTFECVFDPIGWERSELEEKLRKAYKKFYSFNSIFRRQNFRLHWKYFIACFLGNIEFRQFKQ